MAKLKAARVRKRKETGRCEGRKPLVETNPDLVRVARRLRRANPVTGKRESYQKGANKLFELGFATANGTPFKREFVCKLVVFSLFLLFSHPIDEHASLPGIRHRNACTLEVSLKITHDAIVS